MNELIKAEIRNLLDGEDDISLESVNGLLGKYSETLFRNAIKEIAEENEARLKARVNHFRDESETNLKEIFSRIPDENLKSIIATADVLDQKLFGGIYFIKNEYSGHIKIGFANDIKKRYEQIKTGFRHLGMEPKLRLVAVVLGFPKYLSNIEGMFHEEFRKQRKIGEWFKVTDNEIINSILSITDKVEFIDGVLIDYTDYEYQFFPEAIRDYELTDSEIRERFGVRAHKSVFDVLGYKGNKLFKSLEEIEKHRVSIYDTYFDGSQLHKVGVKALDAETELDFQTLKELKFDRNYWQMAINQLQK